MKDTGSNAAEHRVSDRHGPIQERKDTDPERKSEGSVDAANEIFTAHQFISKDKSGMLKTMFVTSTVQPKDNTRSCQAL